jgi:hypothetical protein
MSHVKLYQLKVAALTRVLAERPLILKEKGAAAELRIRFSCLGTASVPGEAADHAASRDVVLTVLELVMVDP